MSLILCEKYAGPDVENFAKCTEDAMRRIVASFKLRHALMRESAEMPGERDLFRQFFLRPFALLAQIPDSVSVEPHIPRLRVVVFAGIVKRNFLAN